MPEISTMRASRFLKKEECGNGILLTIRGCEQMNVAMASEPDDLKWVLTFTENPKPWVINSTNREIIAAFTGKSNTDFWAGEKVVLFHNPSISYGGKLIGGISVRAPRIPTKTGTPPAPAPAPAATSGNLEEDVPF